jgi:EAL domain-containing protein (putative c-di-GMP-specific phosphodiesterase class I)
MISSTANIAKVMRAATVAECVENNLLVSRLRQHGTDLVHGLAIGKAASSETLRNSIRVPMLLDEIANAAP